MTVFGSSPMDSHHLHTVTVGHPSLLLKSGTACCMHLSMNIHRQLTTLKILFGGHVSSCLSDPNDEVGLCEIGLVEYLVWCVLFKSQPAYV